MVAGASGAVGTMAKSEGWGNGNAEVVGWLGVGEPQQIVSVEIISVHRM